MRGHIVFAESFCQTMADALRHAPGIHEDQGRSVLLDQFDDAVVDLLPHLVAGNWAQLRAWNLDRQIQFSFVTDVYDDRLWAMISGEKARDIFDRLLGGRQPDSGGTPV